MTAFQKIRILFIALVILFNCHVFPQKYNIRHFATEQGLIQTQINSMVQDKNGLLYICSQGSGVIVYNGHSFSSFQFKDENIKPDNIRNIFKDSKNNIWFTSYDGLLMFDGKNVSFFTVKEGLPDNEITSIDEDTFGNIWIASTTGLTKYDGSFKIIKSVGNTKVINNIRNITAGEKGDIWLTDGKIVQKINRNSSITYQLPIPLPRNVIKQLFFDSRKKLWAATVSGAYYLEDGTFKKFSSNSIISSNSILGIHETGSGVLWFAVRDFGLIRFDGKNFIQMNEKNGLSSDLIYEVFQDKEGNIWFGTDEGLDLYSNDAFIKYDKTSGLSENLVWSVFEDNKKVIWIITDKFGISHIHNDKIAKFEKQNLIDAKQYYGISQGKDGVYWIASRTGLFSYDGVNIKKITDPSPIAKDGISVICPDKNNNLWFCTFSNGVFKYDGNRFINYSSKNGMLGGEAYYVFDDENGNIWISTSLGISIFDGQKFTNYPISKGIVKKEIFSFKKDNSGGIWGASYGAGIFKFNISEKRELSAKQITTKDGLLNDLVYLIEADDYGHLWVGTQVGLCFLFLDDYYDKNLITIKRYNKEDGIPHAEYNQAASLKDSKGYLWFGTNKGIVKCDPSKIKINKVEPTTIIQNIKIFFKEEDLSKYGKMSEKSRLPEDLRLPYEMNHVTIEFVGISLSNSSKMQYKYMLENFDREWHQATEKNYETYSNLPPGNYTFKILACNDDGLWNKEPVSYSFIILTPFYRTWWFVALSVLTVFFVSWFAYKLRMRKIQLLNKELEKTLKERIVTEKKLLQSEKDYRGLFENAHDAILVIDPIKNIVLEANKEACRMYGYTYEEIINLSFSDITTDFAKAKYNLLDTLKITGWGSYEIQHTTKSGELIEIEANATAIDYKGINAVVAIMHNITERKNIEKALIESKDQAEKSNQLKSNFLAQMSHEIRTPINTILSYTSLLKSVVQDKIPDDLKESFLIIESGGRRLIRTIDSILNMSQIQSGNQEVFPEKIGLYNDVLIRLYNELKQTANIKSIGFFITNNASNDMIIGDHYSIAQLFINLMDNAIKYTSSGDVSVIIENRDDRSVTVHIKDTGIGMSEEFLSKIFQPFSQEEMGYTRHFEGNGLGLALVKSYCDLNKGIIEVESKKGDGTTFSVTFSLCSERQN